MRAILDQVSAGDLAIVENELVRVDAIDPDALTLTLARGCADAVPATHAADSLIYFLESGAKDPTQYVGGDVVYAKLLSRSNATITSESAANELSVTMADRQALPYPPQGLTIGGTAYPSSASGSVTVVWTSRNRVTQADQLIDTTAGSVTPETNTRYGLTLKNSGGTTLVTRSDIGALTASFTLNYTGNVRLELWAINDAGESLQKHSVVFSYTPPGGSPVNQITAVAYVPEDDWTIIDGGEIT